MLAGKPVHDELSFPFVHLRTPSECVDILVDICRIFTVLTVL